MRQINPVFKTVTIRSNNGTTWALSKDPDNFVYERSHGDKSQEQTDGVDSVTDWLLGPVQCTLWLIDCRDRYRWSLIGTNAGQTPQSGKPNGPPQYSACSCPPHCKKGQQFSLPLQGCHLPNTPRPVIIKLLPAGESLVCDIPAGNGKIVNFFTVCTFSSSY